MTEETVKHDEKNTEPPYRPMWTLKSKVNIS